MKHLLLVLFACSAIFAPRSNAQDESGLCSPNDAQCLSAQFERRCGDRSIATARSCAAWIQSSQSRFRADDRMARHYMAAAHVALALFLPNEPVDRLRHHTLARAIYEELIQQDARDADSLLGMATLAESELERIQFLRRIAQIAPESVPVMHLADALVNQGGENDVLEAAEVLDARYRAMPKGSAWAVGARAIALYDSTDARIRASYLRDRMREDLGATALVAELLRMPETTSGRAGSILDTLCDEGVVAALGGKACLDGMQEASRALARIQGQAESRTLAEVVARRALIIAATAGRSGAQFDADGIRRLSSLLMELDAADVESPTILVARARIESDADQKLQILDRAAQLVTDDGPELKLLADEYILLRNGKNAATLLRRLRQLQTVTESERQAIDLNIEALERAEQRSIESGAAR